MKRLSVLPLLRGALSIVAAILVGCGGGASSDTAAPAPAAPAPAPSPPSVSLAVAPDTVQKSASANLTWASTNASACVASGGWSGSKSLTGTEATGALNASTSYTLTCAGAGGTAGQTVMANVTQPPTAPEAPTVTLAVAPSAVVSGSAATLTWSSTNATSCTASGNWSGTKATSGTASTGALTAEFGVCIDLHRSGRGHHAVGERHGYTAGSPLGDVDGDTDDSSQRRFSHAELVVGQCDRLYRIGRMDWHQDS